MAALGLSPTVQPRRVMIPAVAVVKSADIMRVHAGKAMNRVARMTEAIVRGWSPPSWPTGG